MTIGWYNPNVLTQVPELGLGPKVMGKILFIGRQARANQAPVGEGKAELLHFFFGSFRGPAVLGHAVGCNHHCCAVITQTAVYKNLFTAIPPQKCKEFSEDSIFWK